MKQYAWATLNDFDIHHTSSRSICTLLLNKGCGLWGGGGGLCMGNPYVHMKQVAILTLYGSEVALKILGVKWGCVRRHAKLATITLHLGVDPRHGGCGFKRLLRTAEVIKVM